MTKIELSKTVVVSAFPCCGKTYAYEHNQNKYKILDSDSSKFHHKHGEPFPCNYVMYIKSNIGNADIIFISSHLEVREKLTNEGIEFVTVYPKIDMLYEWIGRMYMRGNTDEFIMNIVSHWDEWVGNIRREPHGQGIKYLGNNEFIDCDFLYNWFK